MIAAHGATGPAAMLIDEIGGTVLAPLNDLTRRTRIAVHVPSAGNVWDRPLNRRRRIGSFEIGRCREQGPRLVIGCGNTRKEFGPRRQVGCWNAWSS